MTVLFACRPEPARRVDPGAALPLDRIAIVGASVSAGFGGLPFGDAFSQATKRAAIDSAANVMLFRDPVNETRTQLARAGAFRPSTVFAVDLFFWHVYGTSGRDTLDVAFAELDKLRDAGAWIVVGDIPLITTAADWMLPKSSIPEPQTLEAANERIQTWARRARILLVPLVEWTEPLRSDADVEIAAGEKVPVRSLMALDGLHANPLGTWYVLNRLDQFIEQRLPGTPKDALVFVRPKN